ARHDFPYLIPSGTRYDSGDYATVLDKAVEAGSLRNIVTQRDQLRVQGQLTWNGISTCLEPSGGTSAFETLFNPKNTTTTWMDSCLVRIDLSGSVTAVMATSSSGQAHETLVSIVVGEILHRDPEHVRVIHADSLSAL